MTNPGQTNPLPTLGYPPPTPEKFRYSTDGTADIEWQEGAPTIMYGDCVFLRVCPHCARFVKADDKVWISEDFGPANEPNATCKQHGRVKMPFEGYYP